MTLVHPPPSPQPPPDPADSPRQPESEAAAWLRAGPAAQSRLGARMTRVAVVGAAAGGVGLAAVVLGVHATDLLKDIFLSGRSGDEVALVANGLTAAAAALFAWLLFYSLRLATRTGRLTPRGATDNLHKLRIVTCPLLVVSLIALALGVSRDGPFGETALTVTGCVTFAVCCYVLVSLRRAAWDVALIEGASIAQPHDTRGFTVLSPAAATPAAAPAVAGDPGDGAAGATSATSAPPPAKVLPLPVDPAAEEALSWDEGSSFRDWETLLMALAVLAMAVYVFRTSIAVQFVIAVADRPAILGDFFYAAFGSGSGGMDAASAWIVLALIAFGMCAVGWVCWGVVCLTAGARLRRSTIALAAVTLAVMAGAMAVYVYHLSELYGASGGGISRRYQIGPTGPLGIGSDASDLLPGMQQMTVEAVFPIVVLYVVTRPPVSQLFSRKLRRPRAVQRP